MDAEPGENPIDAEGVIELLGLEPLPVEGGRWAQTWLDDRSSAIYYLMTPGEFSHLHRLDAVEIWHFYAGSPVQMVLIEPDGTASTPILHNRLSDGSRPVVAVAPGIAMGAYTTGAWSLVGTTMAPPYDDDRFELVARHVAIADADPSPELVDHVMRVTHPS